MKITIGSDHAGFELKEMIKKYLEDRNYSVKDFGVNSPDRADYPDYAKPVAKSVEDGSADRGVLVCGSGIGMCMVANRFKGVRAAVLRDSYDAEMSRKHNDANVACFGARVGEFDQIKALLDTFLTAEFEGGRHKARVEKIDHKK